MRSLSPLLILAIGAGCNDKDATDSGDVGNLDPQAWIDSHSDGARVTEGEIVALIGSLSDGDHDDAGLLATWSADGAVICEPAAPQGDGTTTCEATFAAGSVTVTLDVQDPEGAAASASVTLDVAETGAPQATITTPDGSGSYYEDVEIDFAGTASDAEDEPQELVATLESDLDGLLAELTPNGAGAVQTAGTLSAGEHTLTLSVVDSDGKTGSDSVVLTVNTANTAPSCSITAPTDGASGGSGEQVIFAGSVGDDQDGPAGLAVWWSSDLDGTLNEDGADGTGAVGFTTSALTVGTHQITLGALDAQGLECADTILYSVGDAPTVAVTAPSSGDEYTEGDTITVEVEVSDEATAAADLNLSWSSDVDGTFSAASANPAGVASASVDYLSPGAHTITVRATDEDGLYAEDSVDVVVDGLPSAPVVTILPASPDADDDLVAVIDADSVDPEGAPIIYSYEWSYGGGFSTWSSSTLPASETLKGETWTVAVTPNDGNADGPSGTASVTIGNTAPTLVDATLTPDPAYEGDTLICTPGTSSDSDGDSVSFTYAWSVAGADAGVSTSVLTDGYWSKGDAVYCSVTPTDGTDSGVAVDSNAVTISNTAPEVSSVSIAPADPEEGDTLTCYYAYGDADADTDNSSVSWTVGGAEVGTGASLSGGFSAGDTVTCTVTANDGEEDGSTASASVTVATENTPPVVSDVSISPDPATDADTLTCSYSYSDADGDADASTYSWTIGGAEVGTGSTLAGAFSDGDEVTCTVTANDGNEDGNSDSASVTIGSSNADPVISSVTLSPTDATTNDDLTCTVSASDADGDTLSYIYAWFVDADRVDEESGTLGSDNYSRDEVVLCTVTADDGNGGSTYADSNRVTIKNSSPSVSDVSISPNPATDADTLTCSYSYSDADGDADSSTYSWTIGGAEVGTSSTLAGAFSDGDEVTCSVTANDGTDDGNTDSASVTIGSSNTAPVISSVSLTPTTAYEGDTLTCTPSASDADGDSLSYTYAWFVAASRVSESGDTLDDTNWAKDQAVLCTVTADDGNGGTDTADSNQVTISNTAPSISSVSISPSSPTDADTLSCSYSGYSDADGDADSSTYSWTVGGSEVGTSSTLSSGFSSGDTVTCTVTPNDGEEDGSTASDSVTVGASNSAPEVLSISLAPSTVYTDDTLTASVTTYDADGDTVGLTYEWYVAGSLVGETGSSLSGVTYFDKDQTVRVDVTPDDGAEFGSTESSSTITVQNTAPTAPVVSVSPSGFSVGIDDIVCSVDTASTDDDSDTISYAVTWTGDGTDYPGGFGSAVGPSTTTLTDDTVPAADNSLADDWVCTVTPNDGDEDGATDSATASVLSTYVVGDEDSDGDGSPDGSWDGSSGSMEPNNVIFTPVTVSSDVYLYSLGIYISSIASSSQQISLALYDDSFNLIDSTGLQNITTGANDIAVDNPGTLVAAGDYYLAYNVTSYYYSYAYVQFDSTELCYQTGSAGSWSDPASPACLAYIDIAMYMSVSD